MIEDVDYLSRPEQVVLFPGVGKALRQLRDAGFTLFIVTNQSGVGRGYFTLADVDQVHLHLAQILSKEGADFAKIYVAPEAPGKPSRGRKPLPQFLFDARDEYGVDVAQSYVVGDKMSDLQCGWNAGAKKSILVRTGYGREVEQSGGEGLAGAHVVDDICGAVHWILETEAAHRAAVRE